MAAPEHRDRRPQEAKLQPPDLAEHAHDIIEAVRQALLRDPEFVTAAAEHYVNSAPDPIVYPKENPHSSVFFEKALDPNSDSRRETVILQKDIRNPDGIINKFRLHAMSSYFGEYPYRGLVSISGTESNTADAVQEARKFVSTKLVAPQAQAPTSQQE
ncbi:MAG: hypothetical protein ACJ788_02970 [Ktedonobacteraceae bacterium]